jgi:hypothetical protein
MLTNSLKLPKILLQEVEKYAINQGISTEEFIIWAVAEKVGFLRQSEQNETLNNPWLKLAGKYKNDPDFDKVLDYIAEYRQELDDKNETEEMSIISTNIG